MSENMQKFVFFFCVIASGVSFPDDDEARSVADTSCGCLAEQDEQIMKRYGADSVEANDFLNHMVYECRVTTREQYQYCKGGISK